MEKADHPFRNLLCAVDGSFHSFITARYSLVLARAFGAKLYIVTVLTREMSQREKDRASILVARIIDESGKTPVEGTILEGDVVNSIDEFVRKKGIDLVIASTRRPKRGHPFFVRSVTNRLMKRLPCSVIGLKVAHPGRSIEPKRILVPIIGDGFKDAERATIVKAFVDRFGSKITVFHVVEITDRDVKGLDREERRRLMRHGRKRIESFMEELSGRDVTARRKVVIGRRAREEIISEASHHRYDLIIIGATMRNILKRIISGNPVEEILRDTPCDVMLLHFK